MYLGVDGGGTKTAFVLVSQDGRLIARAMRGSCYHPEIGLEAVRAVLTDGIREVLTVAGIARDDVDHAFLGLPAFGEDPGADGTLLAMPSEILGEGRYTVGNDMVCSWAGALACTDGISVIAGTGSIAYGEFAGRCARSGGWGEVFGDEGSAYWIAREGLTVFARMCDGRLEPGPLQTLIREHFQLGNNLDLAGHINGLSTNERSSIAALATVVAEAAAAGDTAAGELYARAAAELAQVIVAVRRNLGVPPDAELPVSYTGGVFQAGQIILRPLADELRLAGRYTLAAPQLEPVIGAALYAARRKGVTLPLNSLRAGTASSVFATDEGTILRS
jgi:N-acetylglucosamine kinase-like BadF-type ATPase